MDEHLFDGDALVIEDHQIQKVVLMDPQKKEYLAVEFDAPLVGIWSPPKNRHRLYVLNHGMDAVTVRYLRRIKRQRLGKYTGSRRGIRGIL